MATPDIYNIQPTQPNMNNPDAAPSDICYLPSASKQSVPPPLYPNSAPPLYPNPAAAPPPPYAMSSPVQMSMYPQHPMFITQMQSPYQGVIITGNFIPSQTAHIKDYMVWSIFNLCLGGLLLGAVAVFLSRETRKRKRAGDAQGARTMSKVTLAFNILITILFFLLTAYLIIYYFAILSSIDGLSY